MDWKLLRKSPHTSRRSLRWTAFASLIAALLGWWLVSHFAGLPAFILPAPEQVVVRFWILGALCAFLALSTLKIR